MNSTAPKLALMADGNLLINLIVEVGYPGKTGGGIALRDNHLFYDATKRHITYHEAQEKMELDTGEKTVDVNKENSSHQLEQVRKRALKANDTAGKATAHARKPNERQLHTPGTSQPRPALSWSQKKMSPRMSPRSTKSILSRLVLASTWDHQYSLRSVSACARVPLVASATSSYFFYIGMFLFHLLHYYLEYFKLLLLHQVLPQVLLEVLDSVTCACRSS